MGAQAVRLSNVDIDNALKNKDFEVLFQPVFDLGNGALARVETFVRWRHPKLGLLPPGAFISFFETQGRMSELTRYVLGSALKAYLDWRGPWAPGLSVNLALSDLSDDAFTTHFTKLLRDHDFPADLVTLECPMPPVDMPIETAKAHFDRLGETGARLAIEVRGRANELLRSLDPFPFDEIKTGGSAILRFARTVRGPGLSAIADLLDVANEANAAITAVGVEDQASLSALRGLGFTAAQGNHLGKVGDLKDFRPHRINEVRALLDLEPLSAENITALFRTEAPAATSAPAVATEDAKSESEDALIDRLNERVAQFDSPAPAAPESAPVTKEVATVDKSEEEKKTKAREKAKALAVAKRAKARADRKNAAIERAKAKAAGKPTGDITDVPSEDVSAVPREMQERLSREFNAEQTEAAEHASAPDQIPAQKVAAEQAAPSVAERAVAQQAPLQAKVAGGGMRSISLAVGASRAYFQPGIRVGAAALPEEPDRPVKPSGLNLPAAQPVMAAASKPPEPPKPQEGAAKAAPQSTVERAMQAAAKPASAPAASAAAKAEAPIAAAPAEKGAGTAAPKVEPKAEPKVEPATQDVVQGDLNAETSDSAGTATPVRRRKSFMKRTVVPLSGHFWPGSWRRAWKRRAAARAANDDQQSSPEDNAEAAE
ncbi:EAL domain-containing protein [Hyphococcus sp.]|uniref:EAL domain-containing protein n=1 Tax=Hyphococcus sp. TaxID=2038636 RepID=UPI002081F29F|nr:MAG: hypothetical protein DHS20C04_27220 [Marinicaulis sp.]